MKEKPMPNNCKSPEMCLLSETCVPCAICPNAKEKANGPLPRTTCSAATVMKWQGWLLATAGVLALAGSIFNGLYVGNDSAARWALCATLAALSGAGTSWRLAKVLQCLPNVTTHTPRP
jgi:hypothetical protein